MNSDWVVVFQDGGMIQLVEHFESKDRAMERAVHLITSSYRADRENWDRFKRRDWDVAVFHNGGRHLMNSAIVSLIEAERLRLKAEEATT